MSVPHLAPLSALTSPVSRLIKNQRLPKHKQLTKHQKSKHYAGIVGSIGLLALTTATPTQAGFFEVLFGQSSPPVEAEPIAPKVWTQEEEFERQRKYRLALERQSTEQASRNLKTFQVLADIAHEQGRKQAFLMDPTLRYGDIVVTDTGLEVYEGKSWKERSPMQFRPLHMSALRNRKDLQVLQRVSGFPAAPEDVQTASAIRTLTIIGQTNAKPAQVRATEAQPTAAQTRTGIPAPKVSKPRLEIIKPAQNRQAVNNQPKAPSTLNRNQNTQNKYISQNSVSPLVANVFYLFR